MANPCDKKMYGSAKYKKTLKNIKEACTNNGHLGGFFTSE
jgi:hypothetical protein